MSLTYNEIHDSYPSLNKTALLVEAQANSFKALLDKNNKIVVYVGCGSSLSIAKSMATMTLTLLNRPSFAVAGGDLLVHTRRYTQCIDGAVVVVVSRSGSTSEIVMAIEKLKKTGCSFDLVSYCCVNGSPLSNISDLHLEMPWAFDVSVCQTRCVTNLYFCGALLLAKIAQEEKLIADLYKTIEKGPAFMATIEPVLEQIANKDWTHAVVLGDAEIGGICEEGSLTYKEICQLPSNYYNMLDSRHGPMVLFNKKTLVVIASTANDLELDLIKDVVHKGSEVIVYSDQPMFIDGIPCEGITNIAFGEELSHIARGIPFILINQLISYYKAKQTGANPDSPDGLDPWIKI